MSKNCVDKKCSYCGAIKPVARSHANRAKNWCCSKECGLAFRRANPTLRSVAISRGAKAKWAEDPEWADRQRARKAAARRPEPVVDNEISIPLVKYPFLNAKGKRCSFCDRMILDRPGNDYETWHCDAQCYGAAKSRNMRGENHPRYELPKILTCKLCRKNFPRPKCFVGSWKNNFCSDSHYKGWLKIPGNAPENKNSTRLWVNAAKIEAKLFKLQAKGITRAEAAEKIGLTAGEIKSFCQRLKLVFVGKPRHKKGSSHPKFLPRIEVECSYCGKTKPREPWHVREGNMYCDSYCRTRASYKGGAKQSRGKSWTNQRALARVRDQDTCQLCSLQDGRAMDVHHIRPYRLFKYSKAANNLRNLVCLCRSCHLKVEGTTDKASIRNWKAHHLKIAAKRLSRKKKPAPAGEQQELAIQERD